MNPFYKNLALWLVITLMMVMLYNLFSQQQLSQNDISYSEFLSMVESDRVSEVTIQGLEPNRKFHPSFTFSIKEHDAVIDVFEFWTSDVRMIKVSVLRVRRMIDLEGAFAAGQVSYDMHIAFEVSCISVTALAYHA